MKPLQQHLANVTLLVKDYDEALAFYTQQLNFELLEDTPLGKGKRWVRIAPPNNTGVALLLAKANTPKELASVGEQAGGRVFLFLQTNDFWRDYEQMQERGVHFLEAPREESYATVAVWEDLYGNKWDLLAPK